MDPIAIADVLALLDTSQFQADAGESIAVLTQIADDLAEFALIPVVALDTASGAADTTFGAVSASLAIPGEFNTFVSDSLAVPASISSVINPISGGIDSASSAIEPASSALGSSA